MTGLSARRLLAGCALSAASFAAFLAPGAATASAACTVTGIKGQGSTLQEIAQHSYFIPGYNAKKTAECGEVTEYKGTGSGAGLEAFGNNKHAAEYNTWTYVGTDQPPNPTQKEAIELAAGGQKLLSIPTLQAATAIIVNLPAGCTSASSKNSKAKTRLMLDNTTLEGIFSRKITKWNQITDDGDQLLPAGCAGESEITRVVRKEGSGTTAITKKYLYQINQGAVDGTENWNELAEKNKNLSWPEEGTDLVRGEGSGGVVNTVYSTAGSIGYVNLANAKSKFYGEGGKTFWAFLQNTGLANTKEKYANPETKGTETKTGLSNCNKTLYVNGVGASFPPENTGEAWNEVSAATKQKEYPLCGFTYDLAFEGEPAGTAAWPLIPALVAPTEGQIVADKHYFEYMVSKKEGQKLLSKETDYLGLPTNSNPLLNVDLIAEKGAKSI